MSGAIPSLPNTPSWRGGYFKKSTITVVFPFTTTVKPTLGPTQPPLQRVPFIPVQRKLNFHYTLWCLVQGHRSWTAFFFFFLLERLKKTTAKSGILDASDFGMYIKSEFSWHVTLLHKSCCNVTICHLDFVWKIGHLQKAFKVIDGFLWNLLWMSYHYRGYPRYCTFEFSAISNANMTVMQASYVRATPEMLKIK